MNAAAPLHGLVLAGGLSTRMQRDKAGLLYAGQDQLKRAVELLGHHVRPVFVSVRASQLQDRLRSRWPMIVDSADGEGPLAGIRSAQAAHPGSAWLVIACDLPFLSDEVLRQLIARRDPAAVATAYRSTHDGLPEPLCAIWEPNSAVALAEYQAGGGRCPRKFLIRQNAPLLEPDNLHALDNINTPQEYESARAALPGGEAP